MNYKSPILCALLVASVTACSGSTDIGSVFSVAGETVHVHSSVGNDALVSAAGDLSIDGKGIAATPQQRELLKRYYESVSRLRDHAVDAGKAGAATGTQAIASVASGLAGGHPDTIGPEIEAKAAKVESAVAEMCANLKDVRALQDELARQLPEYLPYARIDERTVARCHKS